MPWVAGDAEFVDATKLATALMGDSIATNLFMVGYAYQRGLIPLSEAAIMKAIELNGAAIESNKHALPVGAPRGGRSGQGGSGGDAGARRRPASQQLSQSLDEIDRAPRASSSRIPGCGVRQALQRPRGAGARRGGEGACPASPS